MRALNHFNASVTFTTLCLRYLYKLAILHLETNEFQKCSRMQYADFKNRVGEHRCCSVELKRAIHANFH